MDESKAKRDSRLRFEKKSGTYPFDMFDDNMDKEGLISFVENGMKSDFERMFGVIPNTGQYTINHKVMAIAMMSAFQQQKGDKMVPRFTDVSGDTGISKNTLWDWWQNKDKIAKEGENFVSMMDGFVRIKLGTIVLRGLNAIESKNLEDAKIKDLTLMVRQFAMLARLYGGQSTGNVAHKHVHRGVALVAPEDS